MATPRHPTLTGDALDQAVADAARCKAMRSHRWDPIPTPADMRPEFGSIITWRCDTCGSLRYDRVSRISGERISAPRYELSPWYADASIVGADHDTSWWRSTYYETLDAGLFLEAEVKPKAAARRPR